MCTSNACNQGRKPCPTPQACELPVQFAGPEPEDRNTGTVGAFVLWSIVFMTAVAAVSFIAGCVAGTN